MTTANRYEAEYFKSVYEASGKFDPEQLVSKYEEIEKDSSRVQKLKQKFSQNGDSYLSSITNSVFFGESEAQAKERVSIQIE